MASPELAPRQMDAGTEHSSQTVSYPLVGLAGLMVQVAPFLVQE
jgi:hypothetical protein